MEKNWPSISSHLGINAKTPTERRLGSQIVAILWHRLRFSRDTHRTLRRFPGVDLSFTIKLMLRAVSTLYARRPQCLKSIALPHLHFPCTRFRRRGVKNMSQKFLAQLLLGFLLSSIYLTAFLLTVQQQHTSYLSLTQAHSPQRLVNPTAEEMNRRPPFKTTAAAGHPRQRY